MLCAPGSAVVVRDYNPTLDVDCLPWRQVEFPANTDLIRRCVDYSYWKSNCIDTEPGCISCPGNIQQLRVYSDNTFPEFPWTASQLCQTPEIEVRITATIASGPIDQYELDEINSTFSLKWDYARSAYLWKFPFDPAPGETQRGTLDISVKPRANTSEFVFGQPAYTRCGDGQLTYGIRLATVGYVGFGTASGFSGLNGGEVTLWSSCVTRQCQGVPSLTITRSGVPWRTLVNGVTVNASVNLTVEIVGS
jgi:hypothetical protein